MMIVKTVKAEDLPRRLEMVDLSLFPDSDHSLFRGRNEKTKKGDYSNEQVLELVESIQSEGQIYPVLLGEKTDGSLTLADGRARIIALRILGHTHVFSLIYSNIDKIDEPTWRTIVNQHRSVNEVTTLSSIQEMALRGMTKEEICNALLITPQSFDKIAGLANLNDTLLVALEEGKMKPSVAFKAAKLSKSLQDGLAASANGKKITATMVGTQRIIQRNEAARSIQSLPTFTNPVAPAPVRRKYIVLAALPFTYEDLGLAQREAIEHGLVVYEIREIL